MKQILVGVDGSRGATAALGWAGRLGRATGADVVAASVFATQESEVDPQRHEELRTDAERRLTHEWAVPTGGSEPYRTLLLEGSPNALMQAADKEDADLIVVGPEGHGPLASLHIGSLAHHLAHYTERPLAIVPEPGADLGFDRIVVGLDGSDGSADAARWCADVAARLGAHVVAVYAFKPPIEWMPEADPRSWVQSTQHELDEWVAPLRDAGVSFETFVARDAHPVEGLVQTIDRTNADLVVVGARGIGGFLGLRVGRVPLQLVHHTQIPVVMIPGDHKGRPQKPYEVTK